MISRNVYLGLLLLSLTSTSKMFAPRFGRGGAATQRQPGRLRRFFCCGAVAKGLEDVADALNSSDRLSIDALVAIFIAGFTDEMFTEVLVRGVGALSDIAESKYGEDGINPLLAKKISNDLLQIMDHNEITTEKIHAHLESNDNPEAGSDDETRVLQELHDRVVPELKKTLHLYVVQITGERTPAQISAISTALDLLARTKNEEQPWLPLVASQTRAFLTKVPCEANKFFSQSSRRLLTRDDSATGMAKDTDVVVTVRVDGK